MVTQAAKDRAENAKAYIERKYQKLKDEEKERKEGKFSFTAIMIEYSMGDACQKDGETQPKRGRARLN